MSENESKLIDQCVKLKSEKDELLAMLIDVRDGVCSHYNYKAWDADSQGVQRIKDRLNRLNALIVRHS